MTYPVLHSHHVLLYLKNKWSFLNWLSQIVYLKPGSVLIQCSNSCGKQQSHTVKKVLCRMVHPSTILSLPLGCLQISLFVISDFTTICWMCFHVIPVVCLLIYLISMLWNILFTPYSYPVSSFTGVCLFNVFISCTILKRFCFKQNSWAMLESCCYFFYFTIPSLQILLVMQCLYVYSLQKVFTESWHSFRHCVIYRSV